MSEKKEQIDHRKLADYQRGQDAFRLMRTMDDCPHENGDMRVAWLTGWLDARTNHRLGHVLKRNGLVFP